MFSYMQSSRIVYMGLSCVKCEVKLSTRTEYVLFMQKTTQVNLNALVSNN